jgi:hypothetical protein
MENLWNESIFDNVEGEELEKLNRAFERGDLADYEPQPNDLSKMSEEEVIEHAHATRDAFLKSR